MGEQCIWLRMASIDALRTHTLAHVHLVEELKCGAEILS